MRPLVCPDPKRIRRRSDDRCQTTSEGRKTLDVISSKKRQPNDRKDLRHVLEGLSTNKLGAARRVEDRNSNVQKRERSESHGPHRLRELSCDRNLARARYAGMSHHTLPIRDLRDPGTARNQHDRWINEDPTRYHLFQAEKIRWRNHFRNEDEDPIRTRFSKEALQIVAWWRDFIFDEPKIYG